MLVRIEGDRATVTLDIALRLAHVVERRFRRHEGGVLDKARGVVDIGDQRAFRPSVLEPVMPRAIDLDELADALAPVTWLVNRGQAMLAVLPQPVLDHPLAQGLPRHQAGMVLPELFRRQGRPEIGVALLDERHCQLADGVGQLVVARPASAFRRQAGGAIRSEALQQAENLSALQFEQPRRVVDPQPTGLRVHQNAEPRKLFLAHRHHHARRLQLRDSPGRAPSQLCGGVSSVYCGYRRDSRNPFYGTCEKGAPHVGALSFFLRVKIRALALFSRRFRVVHFSWLLHTNTSGIPKAAHNFWRPSLFVAAARALRRAINPRK